MTCFDIVVSSKPGPLLELTPQLISSLGHRSFDEIDARSDYALGMRVKNFRDEATKTFVPVIYEFPFAAEREAVIAHELAHLALNHSSGVLKLNALMAATACTFYYRPKLALMPAIAYLFANKFYTRHAELEADKKACLALGPNITQAMINRHTAKQRLDTMVMGKYSWDEPAFRYVFMDQLWAFLFHVPLDTRIKHLKSLLAEQLKAK